MISVLLDENSFYTGNYAVTGKIDGGINVSELPPEENQLCYKYGKVEKSVVKQEPELEYYYQVEKEKEITNEDGSTSTVKTLEDVIISEDEISSLPEGTEVLNRPKTDEDGSIIMKDVETTETVDGWILDEDKVSSLNSEKLESAKSSKLTELSNECKSIIYNGIDVETTVGLEHYDLTTEDQLNIKTLCDTAKDDPDQVLMYHSSKIMCRVFTKEEIEKIYSAAKAHVTYYTTLYNHLQAQILNMKSIDKINAITFSYSCLTGKYKENFDSLIPSSDQ